jgi:hypothetical protein
MQGGTSLRNQFVEIPSCISFPLNSADFGGKLFAIAFSLEKMGSGFLHLNTRNPVFGYKIANSEKPWAYPRQCAQGRILYWIPAEYYLSKTYVQRAIFIIHQKKPNQKPDFWAGLWLKLGNTKSYQHMLFF